MKQDLAAKLLPLRCVIAIAIGASTEVNAGSEARPPEELLPVVQATDTDQPASPSDAPPEADPSTAQSDADAASVDPDAIDEVIVTASKRAESINDVPLSVSALTNDQMKDRGIVSVADLQKVVSGFRYSEGNNGTPVYSIRGVGFNETSLGSLPNVPVYVDEVPVPFPIMTGGVALDLQRVEVLKGPQGTLFGQNATGGAVNYIAAKPTDQLDAALGVGYSRFHNQLVEGHLSGPLLSGVNGRLAFRAENSGPWQKSQTRDDKLGRKDVVTGRLLLDWQATDDLKFAFNLTRHHDKSEPQALQYSGFAYQLLPAALLGVLPVAEQNAITATPTRNSNRSADWGPQTPRRDSRMTQFSTRADYQIGDQVAMTYIGAYHDFKRSMYADPDGLPIENSEGETDGEIQSMSHELRFAGMLFDGKGNWLVGLNYADSSVDQFDIIRLGQNSNAYGLVLAPLAVGGQPAPALYFSNARNDSYQDFVNKAVFAAFDYQLTDTVRGHVSARHTVAKDDFRGCTTDGGDGVTASAINSTFGSSIAPGGCITGVADALGTGGGIESQPAFVSQKLDEDSNAWRLSLDWKPVESSLLYATVSKGYKAGSFPTLSAFSRQQYQPVVQESLLATELGFKSTFAQQRVQVDGSIFHYDYKNKQVRGSLDTGVPFGVLPSLINVPKSKQDGAELQIVWKPAPGWTGSANATYIRSEILDDFTSYDDLGVNPGVTTRNFDGETLPNTPELQAAADLQYEWATPGGYVPFVGGNVNYQGSTYNGFGENEAVKIDAYTLLDLRLGSDLPDGRSRVMLWVHNVTDEYYWINQLRIGDTITKLTGMPRTFGINFRHNFQ